MNKLIKLGLLSVAFLATIAANASDKLTVKVRSKVLSVSLTDVSSDETIYIKNLQGQVLFSESLNKAAVYSKAFSFSTLASGLYFIESRGSEKIQVTPVVLSDDSVTLVENAAKTFTAPKVTLEGGVINVIVRNYNKVPVSIVVSDEQGTILSETENNTNTLVFGHYDTAALATKNIIISVTEGDYNFVKEVKL